ncbi:MAG: helix-turn-helix domain-containing protein [Candidatus Thermoplasmatota archaeon]|nr:helix-turn-helix domain-containing protein [Candidatus Thermoplasmatota archaeon]
MSNRKTDKCVIHPITMNGEETILAEIRDILAGISAKLDKLSAGPEKKVISGEILDAATLLGLPDHLRRTAMAIHAVGRGTAEDVAKETGNSRSIESAYLNQLVRQGYVKRERGKLKGEAPKKVYFYV